MNQRAGRDAEAGWYRQFGLDRDPFADGGVQGLFYPGGARQETVEQLLHLARYSDCILLTTGVAGAGKTMTRRHFVAQAAADTRCCVLEAALLDGPEQWLRRVMAGFGVHPDRSPDLVADLQALADFCLGRASSGNRCWLIVDDAQDLHEDVVAIIPRVLEAVGRTLRVAFFSEPRWRDVLQAVLPSDISLHTLELQPLDEGETHAYLHYRLNTAGLDGEPPFNAAEYARIHRESAGVPGRINAVARSVLEDAAEVVRQPLSALPLWHFGVIAVTLLALVLLYVWGSLDQDAPRVRPGDSRPVASSASGSEDATVPEIQIAPAASASAQGAARATGEVAEASEAVRDIALVSDSDVTSETPAVAATQGQPPEPEEEIPESESEPEAPATSGPPMPADGASATPVPAGNAPGNAVDEAPPAQDAPPVTVATVAAAASSRPAEPVRANEFVYRAEGRSGGAASADEQFLLGLDPGHFVLQIMGSDDGAKVRAFAARSATSMRVYRKLNNGREWYALVQGEYPSRAAAEAAARELPPRLRDSRPWVRRLDAVQKEIRAARAM